MPKKTIVARYGSREIQVENTWFNGLTLIVDDEHIARNNDLLALNKHKPILSTRVTLDGVERRIEVFAYALWTAKLKICVDGTQIGGEFF